MGNKISITVVVTGPRGLKGGRLEFARLSSRPADLDGLEVE
jgi:hypothetical protein